MQWKAKLYISALSSLVIVQIIFGLLTSSSGSGSSGYGGENLTVHFSNYSLDTFLIVTAIWAFIVALLLQQKRIVLMTYPLFLVEHPAPLPIYLS